MTVNHKTEPLIIDIKGKPIHVGDMFSFIFKGELGGEYKLNGIFRYNPDELRYEIDVFRDSHRFMCLSYSTETMKNFNLLKNGKYKN